MGVVETFELDVEHGRSRALRSRWVTVVESWVGTQRVGCE